MTESRGVERVRQALARSNFGTLLNMASAIIANPTPLLEGLAEAGVLERTEEALIHYSYGVNSGVLRARNSHESIESAVRAHERLTHGPVTVEKVQVRVEYRRVTEWRDQ